jgi:hypothetical protein
MKEKQFSFPVIFWEKEKHYVRTPESYIKAIYYFREIMKVLAFIFVYMCLSGIPVRSAENKLKKSDKLLVLANIYGYARYFYPNHQVKNWDWYKLLVYAQDELEKCDTEDELKKCLKNIFLTTPLL